MRSVFFRSYGDPSVLEVTDTARPTPGDGQVLLRTTHSGVNFAEVMFRRGQIRVDLPHAPGLEAVGVVEEIGAGVTDIKVGDRVAALTLAGGGQAEYAVANGSQVIRLDGELEALSDAHAVAALCNGTTAVGAIEVSGRPEAGERVLVTAAGGGVGTWLIDLLRERSCTVVAATSDPSKLPDHVARSGVQLVGYHELEGLEPFDVIFDSVGGEARQVLRGKVAFLGRHVIMGDAAGKDVEIGCNSVWFGGHALVGYHLGGLARHRPEMFREHMRRALAHGAQSVQRHGEDGVTRHTLIAPEEVTDVHRRLEDRSSRGKYVIAWG